MKILYIITSSNIGGAQTHISQITEHMKENGVEVAVMANSISKKENWLEQELRKRNKESPMRFYLNPHLRNSFNPFIGMKAMKEIRKAVEEFKPDLVSLHSSAAGFWGRLAIKNKVPTIFTAHGWGFTEGAPIIRRKVALMAEKMVAKYCSKIICVSEYDRQLALRYGLANENKLVTVHNGVELSKEISSNHEIQNQNPLVNIVFVGRLAEPKQPEMLIAAFSKISEPIRDVAQIEIIGDGTKREKLQKLIKEKRLENRVKLLGALPREQVFKKLVKADIFTLISHYEGFPRSMLEAMSKGLPIVASNVGGVSEAVYPENGFLIDPVRKLQGNKEVVIQQIENALTKLIMDKGMRHRMGMNSCNRVEQKFSLDMMFKETNFIYKQISDIN